MMANNKQLPDLEKQLVKRFPSLSIRQNVSLLPEEAAMDSDSHEAPQIYRKTSFLHIFNPNLMCSPPGQDTRTEQNLGLAFLPTFHIVVLPAPSGEDLTFQVKLLSYHGKTLRENVMKVQLNKKKEISLMDNSAGLKMINDLSDRKLHFCPGIQLINKKRLIKSLRRVKATHLDKVKNFFVMESFNDDVVLRSRWCQIAMTDEDLDKQANKLKLDRLEEEMLQDADTLGSDGDGEGIKMKNLPMEDPDDLRRCPECCRFQYRTQRLRKEMDEDEDLFKQTDLYIEKGLFRVMKEDSRAFYWDDTVLFQGKKIEALVDKHDPSANQNEEYGEDWDGLSNKKGKGKRSGRSSGSSSKKKKVVGVAIKTSVEGNMEVPFKQTCTICLHTYPSQNSYEIDQRRHAKAFDLKALVHCPLCENAPAMHKRDLTTHFHEVHPERGTCCCECLEILAPEDDGLRKHMLKKHNDAMRSLCPICGSSFTEKYRLKVHIKQMHEKTAEAICDHCGKLFGHRSLMVKHRRLAHGVKSFVCTICEKGFTSIFALNKHLNVHSGLKPYKCVDCDYRSYRLTNVWLHVKKMHNRKGCHEDVEIFEDELKQMQAMELDNVPYKPSDRDDEDEEDGDEEDMTEFTEVYVQEDLHDVVEIQEELVHEIHVTDE